MSNNNLLRGTFVLTLGTYISRFLGMIYVIPFYAMLGETGGTLFQMGYAQYTIFLSIATAGLPMAVSKYVSKYNSMGDYQTSRRIFKAGMFVMLITGFAAFIALYFLAPSFAQSALSEKQLSGISLEDVIAVIRMVSLALIVVPIMSLIRGFFQGHQSMGPTAVSQVIEQIVRIVFLLVSVYLIINVFNGDFVTAVGYATFAAFVGAMGGLIVLIMYWVKRKDSLLAMRENVVPSESQSLGTMFKELFKYAGPFVFVGLAIPIYNYIDTNTFNKAMIDGGHGDKAVSLFSIVVFYIPKLIMIPVSLATAFGLTLVPTITKSFTKRNLKLVNHYIDQALQIIMFFVLPAVVGLIVLAGPAYTLFFEYKEEGVSLLQLYAPVALLFSFFTVSAAILQGINKQKLAVFCLLFGILLKLSLNAPLITMFQGAGSILATAIGFIGSIIYSFAMIKKHAKYQFKRFFKRSIFMAILALFMGLLVSVTHSILGIFIQYQDGRLQSAIILLVAIGAGAIAYLYLAYRSHLIERLFGDRFSRFFKRRKAAS
ncbi:putative polysaccharide biosynthesis protein [Metabacillus arenae]|uniref:Polysaccharide biosynthesis protein n=1 Tax=Metabacillus arenae TaxID=2771434 RepID=A0A926RX24_9BACI|nr:polysaccharide biosynthesis protein [Metabacillus arenae]MBD1380195.1 polysaccharide biosynthesis protein [Metabacillus arenae]